MYVQDWHRWLKDHYSKKLTILQDEFGLFWEKENKKKRINWFDKYHPYHQIGMPRKQHKLIQAILGRVDSRPLVLDACSGLGYDAFLMSLSGCDVIACEKNPCIFALLANMHAKASDKQWCGKKRIKIIFGCALKVMQQWPKHRIKPDVVYLDPMFDKNFKGEVRANAALLKSLVEVENTNEIFALAMSIARFKVVVKRPVYANQLSSLKPTYVVQGKTIRYDVYQLG